MSDSKEPKFIVDGHDRPSFDGSSDREPIEELAEGFAARHRRGESPTIDEYCERHPDLSSQIRDLFPAVLAMERLNHCKRLTNGRMVVSPKLPIERLGDFRVISEIARGGMGIVYEAEQVTLGRHVAVKVLPKHALRTVRDVQRFQREAQTSAKLHHTNIVPVFGVGQQDDTHYIVMQLIRGVGLDEVLSQLRQIVFRHPNETDITPQKTPRSSRIKRNADVLLHDELRRDISLSSTVVQGDVDTLGSVTDNAQHAHGRDRSGSDFKTSTRKKNAGADQLGAYLGRTYFRNVALIGFQAANALSHAHQHDTLHRDVKPANLLLDDEGVVWMADFGIAKALEHDDVTCTGDLVGTVCYMAPERFEGTTNELCDIYSLGLTLYELLTLTRAFHGADRVSVVHQLTNNEIPSPRKSHPSIPRDVETIVLKATARNPEDRYQTAAQLANDLDAFLNDRPIQARRTGYVEHFARWCQRNRAVASLAAAVLMLSITVFVVTSVGYVREAFQRRRAESTARLAVAALDEIYGQFAPRQLRAISPDSSEADEDEDEALMTRRGQLPLSNDVAVLLENLLQFYDQLSHQSSDNNDFVLKSIRANRRVGDIQHRLGEVDKAQVAYERAIERIQQLTHSVGQNQVMDLEYARAQNGLGIVLEDKRMRSKAAEAHRKARDRLVENSELTSVKYELARTLYLLQLTERESRRNRRKRREKDSQKVEHDSKAIAILFDLSEKHPEVSEYQFLLAKCYLARASNRHCTTDKQDEYSSTAIQILEKLVRRSQHVPDYQYELGDAYVHVVSPCVFPPPWKKNKPKPTSDTLVVSEQRMKRALEVTTDLELNHPNIPEYVRLKARMHHNLAKILKDQHRGAEAELQYDQAIEKQRLVVRQSRDPVHHEIWRMLMELHRAQLQRDLKKYKEAATNLEALISELTMLLQSSELHKYSRRMAKDILAKSYIALSDALRNTEQSDKADQALRNAENQHD